MASKTAENVKGSWQRTRWTQALAILLGIIPIYGATIVNHLRQDQPYSLDDVLFSAGVISPILLVGLLLLLRLLCGECFRDLNLKQASWWQDLLGGIGLTVLTLGALYLLEPVIEKILPRKPTSGLSNVMSELSQDPFRLILFLGPVLAVGAAGFEEITRVFLLTRLWKIAPGTVGRWLGVLVSAALVGMAHLYQGPGGVVNTAISALIVAIVYMRFGRVWPLIISHYLHDALQIVLIVFLIRSGTI